MKERPIIFTAGSVHGIQEGRKLQTRRVCRLAITGPNPPGRTFDVHHPKTNKWLGAFGPDGQGNALALCPYGKPGDRLWVRETFCDHDFKLGERMLYRASGEFLPGWTARGLRWKPAIHMPRAASRIMLEITKVRLERVNDISEDDAKAEGVCSDNRGTEFYVPEVIYTNPYGDHLPGAKSYRKAKDAFADLWEHINAARGFGWDVNPWVWAITFRRI